MRFYINKKPWIFYLVFTLPIGFMQCRNKSNSKGSSNHQPPSSQEVTKGVYDKGLPLLTETIKEIEEYPKDINITQPDTSLGNKLSLHQATWSGDIETVRSLIDQRADVNKKAKNDITPLHIAASKGYQDIVALLLEKGADKEVKTLPLLCTPLHLAIDKGYEGIVALLLEKGANIQAKAYRGATALHLAANKGHKNLIKFLLSKGISVNIKDGDGLTPLHLAAYQGKTEVVEQLIKEKATVDAVSKRGLTPLHLAVEGAHEATILKLLENKANIEAKAQEYKLRPLHLAACKGYKNIVELLLSKGAKLEAKDSDKFTALHWATLKAHPTVVEIILDKGAKNSKDSFGNRACKIAKKCPKVLGADTNKCKDYSRIAELINNKCKK